MLDNEIKTINMFIIIMENDGIACWTENFNLKDHYEEDMIVVDVFKKKITMNGKSWIDLYENFF